MKKNLIYMCVFHQTSYINLLELLVRSINIKGSVNQDTTDILVITSINFLPIIQDKLKIYNLPIKYHTINITTMMESSCCKLYIFDYDHIDNYNKILYLDTDVLINNDVNLIFNTEIDSTKIYAIGEGCIGDNTNYWGKQFFDLYMPNYDANMTAFSAGVFYYINSPEIKLLFTNTRNHITKYLASGRQPPICLDQPFLVYNAFNQNAYDNTLMDKYLINNPSIVDERVIYHFPGGPGQYSSKIMKMSYFWNKMTAK